MSDEELKVQVDFLNDLIDHYNAVIKQYKTEIEQLKSMLSVNLQEPTRYWINGDDKCPCCGKNKFEGLDADIWADWQPKYCPNCGTRIYKSQESENK